MRDRQVAEDKRDKDLLKSAEAKIEDAAIEYEDEAPAPSPDDLIDIKEVVRLTGIPKRTIGWMRSQRRFPPPSQKRGLRNLWRRSDVTEWFAEQARPPIPEGEDLLDLRTVANTIGCAQATLYSRISLGKFPKHTHSRGQKHLWERKAVEQWLAAKRSGGTDTETSLATPPPASNPKATCSNCADGKQIGRRLFCRSQSDENPNHNKTVEPAHGCDWHRKPGPAQYHPVRTEDDE